MSSISWITTIDPEAANGKLKELYSVLQKQRGKISNIMAVQSLHPEAMGAHLNLYLALMFHKGGLKRPEREMIAVVVSAINQCDYCVAHHAAALQFYWKDPQKLKAFIQDFRAVALSARERAILEYAEKLTRTPGEMTEQDLAPLRHAGLNDGEILSIAMITGYFNFVNRIANGLGVAFSDEEVAGYHYE